MKRGPSDSPSGTGTRAIPVALLDSHTLFRQAIHRVLEDFEFTIIFEASNTVEFLNICREARPGLGIVDLQLREQSCIETIRQACVIAPEMKILVVSGTSQRAAYDNAIAAGAAGYLHKASEVTLLRTAIEAVLAGGRFLGNVPGAQENPANLTPREIDVLRLVASGCSTKEVAVQLDISVGTADHYRTNLMRKLHLHDAVALTRYALRTGIASLE